MSKEEKRKKKKKGLKYHTNPQNPNPKTNKLPKIPETQILNGHQKRLQTHYHVTDRIHDTILETTTRQFPRHAILPANSKEGREKAVAALLTGSRKGGRRQTPRRCPARETQATACKQGIHGEEAWRYSGQHHHHPLLASLLLAIAMAMALPLDERVAAMTTKIFRPSFVPLSSLSSCLPRSFPVPPPSFLSHPISHPFSHPFSSLSHPISSLPLTLNAF